MKRWILRKDDNYRSLVESNVTAHIAALNPKRSYAIEIKEYRKKRSLDQNAYIHAVPLKIISDETGYTMDEIKEYLCGEFTGWEEFEMFGEIRSRPIKTTSQMSAKEMTDFIDFMQWWGSHQLNLRIPSPNEWVE